MKFGGVYPTTAALRNALAVQGCTMSEAMVLGISGGLGAGYILWEFKAHDAPAMVMGFSNRWNYWAERTRTTCERLGAAHEEHELSGAKAANQLLKARMETGKPCLAWTDKASLPYQHLPATQVGYSINVVGVHGWDGDTVLVDDLAEALIPVTAEDFAQARAPIPSNKRRLLFVDAPGSVDWAGAVRTGISDHIEHLSRSSDSFSLPVYAKWAKTLTDTKNKKGWPVVFKNRNGLAATLSSCYEGVMLDMSDGSGLRNLYAAFLEEAAGVLGQPGLMEAAAAYRQAGAAWKVFAETALDHPALVIFRTLMDKRYQQYQGMAFGAMGETITEIYTRMAAMNADFPLDEAALMAHLGRMQAALEAVHAAEVRALETLKQCYTA
jgi:hypothetical protein